MHRTVLTLALFLSLLCQTTAAQAQTAPQVVIDPLPTGSFFEPITPKNFKIVLLYAGGLVSGISLVDGSTNGFRHAHGLTIAFPTKRVVFAIEPGFSMGITTLDPEPSLTFAMPVKLPVKINGERMKIVPAFTIVGIPPFGAEPGTEKAWSAAAVFAAVVNVPITEEIAFLFPTAFVMSSSGERNIKFGWKVTFKIKAFKPLAPE